MLPHQRNFIINMAFKLAFFTSLIVITSAQYSYQRQSHVLSDPYKSNRIIGGTNAVEGEFPHQVSLQLGYPPYIPLKHVCGGTIINEEWILTAAHCVYTLPQTGQFLVKAGKCNIKSHETTEQSAYVAKVLVHHKYRGEISPYDIALLRLMTPFKFNKFVNSINLPVGSVISEGKDILSGWGSISTSSAPILPQILQKVTLPLIDNSVCRRAMRMLGERGEIHDTNLCTGPLTGGFSACSGDSGGPLISINENGAREIIGVVSWGQVPCGGYGFPTVFARVSAFVGWINHIINNHNY